MVKGELRMLIGELAKRTGLTRDTIRFYEKEELIAPEKSARKSFLSNSYKNYPEAAVADLVFIQRTKVLGFTLAEIRDMLSIREHGQKTSRKWAAEAEAKLQSVDRKILELRELRTLLAEALVRCSDQCFDAGCDVLDGAVARKSGSRPRAIPGIQSPGQGGCCS